MLIAFGFGAGLYKKAPGTAGTLVALPLIWLLKDTSSIYYLSLILGLCLAGVFICGQATRILKLHDHPGVVFDEIVGMLLTLALLPVTFYSLVAGFILFRFFDIFKPWPIRLLDQKVKHGFGIMIDDVVAGLMANIVLQIVFWFVSF